LHSQAIIKWVYQVVNKIFWMGFVADYTISFIPLDSIKIDQKKREQ